MRVKDVINQFMWGYQQHFRSGVQRGTERSLTSIGVPVEVQAVLVGFAIGNGDKHPICIEPEDGSLQLAHIANVASRTAELAAADPENRMFYGHPIIGQRRHAQVLRSARARALVEAIEASGVFQGLTFFASNATPVGGYEVHVCIGIETRALAALPSLEDEIVDRVHVGRSLHHEVIAECLRRADLAMYLPDAGADCYPLGMAVEDIVKSAAVRLTRGATYRVTGMPGELFEAVNAFSSLGYERANPKGRLVVTKKQFALDNSRVQFRRPVSLQEPRVMRKLLEVTDYSLALLVDEVDAYGVGTTPPDTPAIEIRVLDRGTWDLTIGGKRLMKVAYGQATLPAPLLSLARFTDIAMRTVGLLDVEKIWRIVQTLQASGHGTTLVVSSNPSDEAARLSGPAIVIEPCNLDPDAIVQLSRIDGAVILGPNGDCHAFGAILDGVASGRGDQARGSRFNSALRYHGSCSQASLVVVVSDDGMVDLIPSLRPQVDRDEVEAAVLAFCDRCSANPVDGEEFARAHDRVMAFAFYLNEEQCKRVSDAYANEMERRFKEGGVAISRPPLHPHPDMNDSYFA
jgi:hypothetical protein